MEENLSEPSSKESWNVFHDDVLWMATFKQSRQLPPKTRPLALNSFGVLLKQGNVLARKAGGPHLGVRNGSDLGDVSEVGDIGPMLPEDGGGVGVDFGETDGFESDSFKAETESANTGEEVGHAHTNGPPCILGRAPLSQSPSPYSPPTA